MLSIYEPDIDMAEPTILWLRKDFRLTDNPALMKALEGDRPIIPVFILDPTTRNSCGAAPLWRLGRAIEVFAAVLEEKGQRLVLRSGDALGVLRDLIKETGATRVVWGRQYDKATRVRDTAIKDTLKADGIDATSVRAHLMFEPWTIETKTGGPYRVYSPFKRACFEREDTIGEPLPIPADLAAPDNWPQSETLEDWALGAAMNRGGAIVDQYARVGEAAALERLEGFIGDVAEYDEGRNALGHSGTSGLSENFAWGEISTRTAWHRVRSEMARSAQDDKGAVTYLQELLWREFAYHLLFHYPDLATENWREEWRAFPWREDNEDAERWRRGQTGVPGVDAAMRELYATGIMHNRMRMLTASFLTKHLMTDWRVGEAWFRECLIDWDPASNAMGWQWVAGSGPDATPFFRIFNPETQVEKFDPQNRYVSRWLDAKSKDAQNFFAAIPQSWKMTPKDKRPAPLIGLKEGRERALAAYKAMRA